LVVFGALGEDKKMLPTKRAEGFFSHAFSWKDIFFPTTALVALNVIDVVSTFYGVTMLGFVELNPLAVGFHPWIVILKCSACLIPLVCAYALDKSNMNNYMFLPLVFSIILVEFYTCIVVFGMCNIFLT
jgi:hypothetical protein